MKNVVLLWLTLFVFSLHGAFAQEPICEPDRTIPDTLAGVFPPPFSETNPMGGISDTACINEPFYFVFTVRVPATFNTPFGDFPVDSFKMDPERTVKNLPTGIDYACNPPDCIITKFDSIGCVALFGTPSDPEDIGVHDLQFDSVQIFTPFLPITISFPDSPIPLPDNFTGNYFLHVKPEGTCSPSSVNDLSEFFRMTNSPNPFNGFTLIHIQSTLSGRYVFRVHDLLGRQVHQEPVDLFEGENQIDFDGSKLANGMYIYSISDGTGVASAKMIVNRR